MTDNKRKNINVTTEEGIFKFPKLNAPDTKYKADGEYGVKVILSQEAAQPIIDKLNAEADRMLEETKAALEEKVSTEKGEKKAKAKKELDNLKKADLPVKDCVDDDGEPNGDVELNFKMKAQRTDKKTQKIIKMSPKVFDAKGNPMKVVPQIWGGTKGCVAGQIVPFYTAAVGAGASLRLSAVQVIDLVNGSGGTADSYGFGAKDGYEAEENEGAAEGFTDQSGEGADAGADEF
jgi:hypothetical protein